MSRLEVATPNRAQQVVEVLYHDLERRIIASPPGLCPVDLASSFLKLCRAQTCGKCVPCRIGLAQLENLLEDVLEHRANKDTLKLIEKTARVIEASADCAIGYEAANMILKGVKGFAEDYHEHIVNGRCTCSLNQPVPCVELCPAEVDIPGYIALIHEGRYGDAVRLIRKDNPFPTACGYVCEHPCEARCRRNMVDDAINIRGLKRYAVDHSGEVPPPAPAAATGKRVAVIGAGPAGLSAAYFLQLMGHSVTVFESKRHLGGMLRYGIPSYRLPRERLQQDLDAILATGVEVKTGINVGKDLPLDKLVNDYDAVYVAIGAHSDKKLNIPGEGSRGVISAVELLRSIGEGNHPDFTGKNVAVVGGGNVAMDVARSAIRLGAAKVSVIYRRRIADMTALAEEIEGAIAEGCEILSLHSPHSIETDADENVTAMWLQPQIIGHLDDAGRPCPSNAETDKKRLDCDLVVMSVGQSIEIDPFETFGVPTYRGTIVAENCTRVGNTPKMFAGGDCVTGPATVIKAIAAGKVAAANIDNYLGFNHEITSGVEVPPARLDDRFPCGRVNMTERESIERRNDFDLAEYGMTAQEACQEASRCLRCDHFGYGIFKGGRIAKW